MAPSVGMMEKKFLIANVFFDMQGKVSVCLLVVSINVAGLAVSAQDAPQPQPVKTSSSMPMMLPSVPGRRGNKDLYGLCPDITSVMLQGYMDSMRDQMSKHAQPMLAFHKGTKVVVAFKLHKDGEVSDLHVTTSSGVSRYDQIALKIVATHLRLGSCLLPGSKRIARRRSSLLSTENSNRKCERDCTALPTSNLAPRLNHIGVKLAKPNEHWRPRAVAARLLDVEYIELPLLQLRRASAYPAFS